MAARRQPAWVAYVGPFTFPWGQPGSRRVLGIAKAIAAGGGRVVVVSGEAGPAETTTTFEEQSVGGIVEYVGAGEFAPLGASLLSRHVRTQIGWGSRTVEWLSRQTVPPSHVIVYGGGAQYMAHLRPWCRRNGVSLAADVVEWYDPRQFKGRMLAPAYLSSQYALRRQYPKADGVIAISTYLADHYAKRGTTVVRVPPTLDVEAIQVAHRAGVESRGMLEVLYFGTPGRKDALPSILRAAEKFSQTVRLTVAGPSQSEVKRLLGVDHLPGNINSLGRVEQEVIGEAIQSAHFTVLARERARFSEAGFPTKLVESLANGVPVLCNLVGDLGHYITDGEQGIVFADSSVDQIADGLRRAVALSDQQRTAMQLKARDSAESDFDYRRYVAPMASFLDSTTTR